MLYHVVRRPLHHNKTNSSNQSRNNQRSGSVPPSTLMPRYHYSRTIPNSATNNSDLVLTRNHFDTHSLKPTMTATTTTTTSNNNNNNNNNTNNSNSYGSFKSTIIPLVTNNRTTTPNKREFIQIPITREDGTSVTINNQTRSVPVSFINETNTIPPTGNNNNGNISPRPTFTNLLRPTSKYFQYHFNHSTEDPTVTSNVPHLPSLSRRLSLTIPVTTTVINNTEDEIIKPSIPSSSSNRPIPIRLPQSTTATVTSLPSHSPRMSSAVLQSSPLSNSLQRQKTDIGNGSSSSPTLSTINNSSQIFDFNLSSPIRRAEVMAREAIQGITRLQQRNNQISEINPNRLSPTLSRRVIINLKNNQSVSLDSRLSSAMKPPQIPPPSSSSSRFIQRNNLYHIPVLHEIQMSSYPTTNLTDSSGQSISVNNNGNYKNEFHMEIPVTITTNNDQENQIQTNNQLIHRERLPSANNNSNQTLKSILKRSSSRETVSRKNVSFMNA